MIHFFLHNLKKKYVNISGPLKQSFVHFPFKKKYYKFISIFVQYNKSLIVQFYKKKKEKEFKSKFRVSDELKMFYAGNIWSYVKFSKIFAEIRFIRRWRAFSTNGIISLLTASKFWLITLFTASPETLKKFNNILLCPSDITYGWNLPNTLSPLNRLFNFIEPFPTLILIMNFLMFTRPLPSLRPNCNRTVPVDSAKHKKIKISNLLR